MPTAAIVTVGSELVEGLRIDTNTAEIARALQTRGFSVAEAISVGDDAALLRDVFERLLASFDLVITTGGLGPTHDDITRDAAAAALGVVLVRDEAVAAFLEPWKARHRDADAAEQLMVQALVIPGSRVLHPTTGTAPGLVVSAPSSTLVLLPGPPSEMRPMLTAALAEFPSVRSQPVELGVTGLSESDAQLAAQRGLAGFDGVTLTVLARPGDVKVILFDDGVGEKGLLGARDAVAAHLGDHVYASDGSSLAQAVLDACRERPLTVSCAESCTGGMVATELTDIPGASDVFIGGVVSYADSAKMSLLGVSEDVLRTQGAVSREAALAMAEGARLRLGSSLAVAVTGIAGPDGGSAEKPVGLVWFAVSSEAGTHAIERRYPATSRAAIRARSTSFALDLLRRTAIGLDLPR